MKKYFWMAMVGLMTFMTPKSSSAFLSKAIEEAYNVIPISPVVNFAEDLTETGKMLGKTYAQVQSLTNQIKKDATSLKSSLTSAFSSMGINFIFTNIGGTQNTLMCGSVLGSVNVTKMSLKLQEILLSYKPGQKELVQRRRQSFYMDNIYNIYAAIQVMKDELSDGGEIGSKIISAKECCSQGGQGEACGVEGNNEILAKYGYALSTLEDLIKMWERVAALKAQKQAIDVIMSIEVQPEVKKDNKKDNKVSLISLPTSEVLYSSHRTTLSVPMGYAQMLYKSNRSSLSDVEQTKDETQKAKKSRFSGMGLNFVAPKMSDDTSPMLDNIENMEAFNELSQVEDAVSETLSLHNFIRDIDNYRATAEQYKSMQENYQKKLNMLRDSNQCGKKYIGRYFNSVDQTWSGIALNNNNVNDYDLRKGISGWAFNAYEVAKGAETTVNEDEEGNASYSDNSAVQVDDLETDNDTIDDADVADNTKGADLEESESKVKKNKDSYDKGEGVSASTSDKTKEENRKATMLAWQIGAEASKDLSKNASSWGTPNNRKMIWNDTKIFYNQYLQNKYGRKNLDNQEGNIRAYLKRFTESDVVDVILSALSNAEEPLSLSQTEYQTQLNEKYAAVDTALQTLFSQNSAASTQADANLLQQQKNLKAQIDEISAKIKSLSDEVGDIASNSEDQSFAEMDSASSKELNYLDDSASKNKLQKYDEISSEMSGKVAQNKKDNNFDALKKQLDQAKSQRDALQKQMHNLEQQIEDSKAEKQSSGETAGSSIPQSVWALYNGFNQEKSRILQQYTQNLGERFNSVSQILNIIPDDLPSFKEAVTSAAGEIVTEIMGNIDSIVDDAYSQMLALGDDLYLPTSAAQVASIHQNMINRLKAMTITKSVFGYSLKDLVVFADLATLDTSPETEGFFVGALPRARDLKAPYPMSDLSQPPVREVFHFDMTDYSNVKAYSSKNYNTYNNKKSKLKLPMYDKDELLADMRKLRGISRGDFLNYGGEIPKIWQLMLQDYSFIEKKFNLQSALTQGCESAAFLRGGIMPCRIGDTGVVLDVNVVKEEDEDNEGSYIYTYDNDDDQYIRRTDLNPQNLPKCLLIELKKSKPFLTFYDGNVNIDSSIFGNDNEPAETNCPYSELGMLLDADENNNISFKSTVYEVFNDSFKIEDTSPKKLSQDQKNQLAIAQQAELSRNQIGDFLRQAESEKKMKQSLEEMKQKYDDQIKELRELLAGYGFTVSNDYDLTKQADYNLTISRLKAAKNQSLNKVNTLLGQIKVDNNNKPAKVKKDTIDKIVSVLQLDTEADLELSMSSADDNDINAELKRAKADREATEKYQKKVKDENSEEYKDLEEAYCANY